MNIYLIVILFIIVGNYLLNAVVETANVRYAKTDLPKEYEGYYDADKYRQSQDYLKENTRFEITTDTIITPITVTFILVGGFNIVDGIARGFGLGPILTGLIFAGILLLALQLMTIPFSVYNTFIIEEKYGFNRTTPKTFILDILKSWLLAGLIGGIVFSVILWLFARAESWAWVYCWVVVVLFQIVLTFLAPVIILPLFNKFYPLEDGELKAAIEDYARSQRFKMKGIFKMDASKRSTKSNAFFTGFGKLRRIVLFDTLIKRHTTLFSAFKMQHTSIYASLFFFAFLYAPINLVISIFSNILSRRHEYEADAYAVSTYRRPESMISALKKLTVDNLSNLTPHPLKVFLTYGHPPVLERIRAIRELT
ncbi:MAG: M48 family metallopeptidase [Deltaproteobacteria bacterium]|nr:M48 family metallopeptidase [Deltaproteobacteria bacterium]